MSVCEVLLDFFLPFFLPCFLYVRLGLEIYIYLSIYILCIPLQILPLQFPSFPQNNNNKQHTTHYIYINTIFLGHFINRDNINLSIFSTLNSLISNYIFQFCLKVTQWLWVFLFFCFFVLTEITTSYVQQ